MFVAKARASDADKKRNGYLVSAKANAVKQRVLPPETEISLLLIHYPVIFGFLQYL